MLTKCASCLFFAIYIYFLGIWKSTWVPFSRGTFLGMGTWLKLAVPGMVMLCAEWWSFEINIFVAGSIGVDSLAAMTLLFSVLTLLYTVSLAMSIAASVKVGNAVGQENIPKAKQTSWIVLASVFVIQSGLALSLYLLRDIWPFLFTSEEGVVSPIHEVALIISIFTVIDSIQNTFGGIIRGCGKQYVGAFTYIGSYYGVGLALGIPLALVLDMGIKGQWIGITCASTACVTILGGYFLFVLNWEAVVKESKDRLAQKEENSADKESLVSEEMQEFSTTDSSRC